MMVGVDADRVVTLKGSRVLGDDFSDTRQGQFFKEARNLEIPASLLLFPYHRPEPILNGLKVRVVCLQDLQQRLVGGLDDPKGRSRYPGPVGHPGSPVRRAQEYDALGAVEYAPEMWFGVVSGERNGFLADEAAQAVGDKD
ncbi:hypothetical protein ACJZ2D_017237 [Fusarium nematophilum]